MRPDHVLGVDGGNTKTLALVARVDGTIVGSGRGGCADIYQAASEEAALAATAAAVEAALAAAGIAPPALISAAFSMAGADWPEDFVFLEAAMRGRGFGRTITVVNDAIGALRAGSPDGAGVAVVCGTGAAVGARSPDGRVWHSGWWQQPQGSRHLARQAMDAVYRAELGIDPPTRLTGRALEVFERRTVEDVLHLCTARGVRPPDRSARMTHALLEEAAAGDDAARRIVLGHGRALGDFALVAARRVGLLDDAYTLVLAGGVLRHPSSLLTEAIAAQVRRGSPRARPVMSRFEPAVGALLLALEDCGSAAGEPLLTRLQATLPPAAFFATR
ncbi:MAG: hypothetical protein JOZ41_18015 [Chloroflexi bacterium]|nr:hypothetical protein [Chloroflexota bacterium]